MNDTVAELRSRPYQIGHIRSATNQHGSTVVDDDTRKSDYKRMIGSGNESDINQAGGIKTKIVNEFS